MKRYLCFVFLLPSLLSFSQNIDSLISYYELKAEKYLVRDSSVYNYFEIDEAGIRIFASAQNKEKDSAEFFLRWNDLSAFKHLIRTTDVNTQLACYAKRNMKGYKITSQLNTVYYSAQNDLPLLGKKIAIDPGHIGGDTLSARREKRLAKIKSEKKDEYVVTEGSLTMQTALILKSKLEKLGATVLLTRSGEGQNAFGYSFDEWMKKDFEKSVAQAFQNKEISDKEKNKLLNPKTTEEYIYYHFFIPEELKQRAVLINDFKPDLTVIIHYNVDETNKNWSKPSEKNCNMVFIPGAFMDGEMETVRNRFEFLRLLVNDDLSKSASLSSYLIKRFETNLKVPAATQNDASYLQDNCKSTPVKGVFCRNLTLTRYVHGTIIYGEPLYLDNINEYKMLSKPGNTRIQLVADSFYEAVLQYFQK